MRLARNSGFTMFEILMVLVIIGALITFLWGPLAKRFGESDVYLTKLKLSKVKNALMEYKMHMGHYPTKKEGGLRALIDKPSIQAAQDWRGPYVESEDDLLDKWAHEVEYYAPPKNKNKFRYFEIISYGADGQEGGKGDDAEISVGN